jgi:hypothetical protein
MSRPADVSQTILTWRMDAINRMGEAQIQNLLTQIGHMDCNPTPLGLGHDKHRLKVLTKQFTEFLKTLDGETQT